MEKRPKKSGEGSAKPAEEADTLGSLLLLIGLILLVVFFGIILPVI